jgi:hypothetical protein
MFTLGSRGASAVPLAASIALVFVGCGSTRKTTLDSSPPHARIDSLIVTIPVGFNRYEIHRDHELVGIVVADYRIKPGSATLTKGVFPGNAVALVIGRATSAASRIRLPPLRLPLRLNELRGPQRHSNGFAWNGTLRLRGSAYVISFWNGRQAAPRDRSLLLRALVSIRALR